MKNLVFKINILIVSCLLLFAPQGCKKAESGQFELTVPSYARLPYDTKLDAVEWTEGFWHEYMLRLREIYIPGTLDGSYISTMNGASFRNFLRAAGMEEGGAIGRIWGDGDCYLVLDATTRAYAYKPDEYLESKLKFWTSVISKIQGEDGHIDTWKILKNFDARTVKTWERFEVNRKMRGELTGWAGYNLAHLHVFATTYHEVFGDDRFLDVADKALMYLMYNDSVKIHNNIVIPHFSTPPLELYRRTKDESHLQWMQDIYSRNTVFGPPLRDAEEIFGHNTATSHTLLGGTMLYALTGETAILDALNRLAENLLAKKIYITGALAPLGLVNRPEITVKGIKYESVRMGEAIGEAYDLPGEDSYCESCGQCLFMEWFYKMFRLTGNAIYMDATERMLYNTTMGTADLNRPNFFYSNPQEQGPEADRRHEWVPETRGNEDHLTWTRTYSKLCACCPPKVMRAIAMTPTMAYDINDEGVWVNLYGSNNFRTKLPWGGELECVQTTNYPWEGKVKIELTGVNSAQDFPLFLRIPGWVTTPVSVSLNREEVETAARSGSYYQLNGDWKAGDIIEMEFPMPVRIMAADPRIEENVGKVAVMRGPVVYALENEDVPEGVDIFSLFINGECKLEPVFTDELGGIVKINGSLVQSSAAKGEFDVTKGFVPDLALYQETSLPLNLQTRTGVQTVNVSLIPFYSRLNRKGNYFKVWIPVVGN